MKRPVSPAALTSLLLLALTVLALSGCTMFTDPDEFVQKDGPSDAASDTNGGTDTNSTPDTNTGWDTLIGWDTNFGWDADLTPDSTEPADVIGPNPECPYFCETLSAACPMEWEALGTQSEDRFATCTALCSDFDPANPADNNVAFDSLDCRYSYLNAAQWYPESNVQWIYCQEASPLSRGACAAGVVSAPLCEAGIELGCFPGDNANCFAMTEDPFTLTAEQKMCAVWQVLDQVCEPDTFCQCAPGLCD